jgi:hypothetical protein
VLKLIELINFSHVKKHKDIGYGAVGAETGQDTKASLQ